MSAPAGAVLTGAIRHLNLVSQPLGFAERALAIGIHIAAHDLESAGATDV